MGDDLYRVLYKDRDGHEQLTDAMSYDAAYSRAKALETQGNAVGSVMGDVAARGYMHARYAPTYRGVDIPLDLRADGVPYAAFETWKRGVDAELDRTKPAAGPSALDLSMSPEVADFVLRAVTGLLEEGCGPGAYAGYGLDDADERDLDGSLILRAADIVGRENINNRHLQRHLAELDGNDGSTT